MRDAADGENFLSLDDAYVAAWFFIRQFYERDGRKPESMFLLLNWMRLDAERATADPAQWSDWMASVGQALSRDKSDLRLPEVSPPASP
jgi:hypothetical protein